ncbi:TonB-dependent receptor domain-containing protein [Flavobacterium sp.]|uniref:TonB-dependent receptor plug domain-containing protein n=1 Tax=Flavobacterium sp. TaxID=239 RepID=UPI00286C5E7D|nr:TonB-dependent receptor [Flavobacterium sp.]
MKKITLLLLVAPFSAVFAQNEPNETKSDTTKVQALQEIQIVGSRNSKRTVINSAVPIDIINVKDVTTQSGKIEINELLQYLAPSFNANKQSGSDGADHVDPASLRGMGPDQTLVLINGKRRHQSSLINLFGTRGRGNTGTDLNAIPATAIKRIEILRDGAAAQYGSDAIAGVINIVLNDNVNEFNGSITTGIYKNDAQGDFLPGTPNTPGYELDQNGNGNTYGKDHKYDGFSVKAGANYGVKIGKNGGFANFTGEYLSKDKTLRPSFDFRKGFGDAEIKSYNLMVNLQIPLSKNIDFYAFGGRNNRNTDAYAFTRNGGERVVESIYPGGYTPRITSEIIDNSAAFGFKAKAGDWKIDLSNAFGQNQFDYTIKGTINASLEDASPTEFDAGGFSLSQNTTNLDFTRNFKSVLNGLNFAFGGEYRIEKYEITAGEEGSWATYDTSGNPIDPTITPPTQSAPIDPISGNPRPGGSQGFPGFSPANEVSEQRTSAAAYVDAELDVSDEFLLGTALRYENYSDFGNTLNLKMAYKYKLCDNVSLRGSFSTGFRAPSLAQIYFNTSFTNFNGSGASEVLLAANGSAVTEGFGIDKLKEEKSRNGSIGLTGRFGKFTATVDGYLINVSDRIVLTGYFDATALNLNVDSAQFFVNGVSTVTQGIDVVMSWKNSFGSSKFGATLIGNINSMQVTHVNNGALDQETFFGAREIAFLKASAPNSKFGLNLNYERKWFDIGTAFTRFSKVVLVDYAGANNVYDPKIVTDLTLGFQVIKQVKLTVGSNNLFNIYPTKQDESGNTEAGGYWDAVQMGFNGAYYYTRLSFKF